jgi:hypothetical protein
LIRLTADLWIAAYLARLRAEGIAAYITRKGDAVAGAVVVKLATMDGRAVAKERIADLATGGRRWAVLAEGPEADVDAVLTRARARDPDLWVIEVEDRRGRDLLDSPGLE